jgi:5-formyltetrahydrofolate cyclo-ligase
VIRYDKRELRRHCRTIRDEMPLEKVRTSSRAVCAHLSGWSSFQQANTVLSFLAFCNEIDLGPLFDRWPSKRWLVPRIVDGTELAPGQKPFLVLHAYDPKRLVRHRFGMLEPEPDLPTINPGKVNVVLVPGIAFDRKGGRLGFGGGFYDRLLPLMPDSVRIGVTFDELVLDAIPMEPWDCRVDWLVTPTGLIRTQQGQPLDSTSANETPPTLTFYGGSER